MQPDEISFEKINQQINKNKLKYLIRQIVKEVHQKFDFYKDLL